MQLRTQYRTLLILVSIAGLVSAQTRVDLQSQSKGMDFTSAQSTKPFKTGTVLPPACTTGDVYLLTTAKPGMNIFTCIADNIWTAQGGAALPASDTDGLLLSSGSDPSWTAFGGDLAGGMAPTVKGIQGRPVANTAPLGGDVMTWDINEQVWKPKPAVAAAATTLQVGGVLVGQRPVQNHLIGTGVIQSGSDSGTAINIQTSVNTAYIQTRTNAQSGADLKITLTSTSGAAFHGRLSPMLGMYSDGMTLQFRPNVDCAGWATLEIDGLGAKPLYDSDGVTAWACKAGQQSPIWYDAKANANLGGWRTLFTNALPPQTGQSGKVLTTNGVTASWGDAGSSLPAQTGNTGKFLSTNGTTASWATITNELPAVSGNGGRYLTTDGTSVQWAAVPSSLPTQTGQSGKVLTTNGVTASWGTAGTSLPAQTGNTGKFLSTNGTTASWATITKELPAVLGNGGRYLTTDGTSVQWATVTSPLPTQTGNLGKYLTTNGTAPAWVDLPAQLPAQSGKAGKFLTTDGSTSSWSDVTVPRFAPVTIQMPVAGVTSGGTLAIGSGWLLPASTGTGVAGLGTDPRRYALVFANTGSIRATYQFHMPDDWDGSVPTLTLHFSSAGTGTLRVGSRLRCVQPGEGAFVWSSEAINWTAPQAYDTANVMATMNIAVTSNTNCAGGRLAYLEVVRDDTDANSANLAVYHAALRLLTHLQ